MGAATTSRHHFIYLQKNRKQKKKGDAVTVKKITRTQNVESYGGNVSPVSCDMDYMRRVIEDFSIYSHKKREQKHVYCYWSNR